LSDHCRLLLADDRGPRKPRTFKFENFWLRVPGFKDVVPRRGMLQLFTWSRVNYSFIS
jgi:hypothetical protein